MKRLMFWIGLGMAMAGFLGPRPAYAPPVTVQEEKKETSKAAAVDSDVVDLSDLEEAEGEPTWSPSFENQNEPAPDEEE